MMTTPPTVKLPTGPQPAFFQPVPPLIQSDDALDIMWTSHRKAEAEAEEAGRRKDHATSQAEKAKGRYEQLRAQIESLQQKAAEAQAKQLEWDVLAEEAGAAEKRLARVARELGAAVEFNVQQGSLQHPAERQQTMLPPPHPAEDTAAFPAAQAAATP